jgi:hypothetical protein
MSVDMCMGVAQLESSLTDVGMRSDVHYCQYRSDEATALFARLLLGTPYSMCNGCCVRAHGCEDTSLVFSSARSSIAAVDSDSIVRCVSATNLADSTNRTSSSSGLLSTAADARAIGSDIHHTYLVHQDGSNMHTICH